tara:strand:+ start:4709 stop:4981 length:273 start_codon:yes stop_codon:yes gene_type:complete
MHRLFQTLLKKLPFVVMWRKDWDKEQEVSQSKDEQLKSVLSRIDCCLKVLDDWNNNKIGNLRAVREIKEGLFMGKRIPEEKFHYPYDLGK